MALRHESELLKGDRHGASSAAPLLDEVWQPVQWRDDRCVRWRISATESEALEAIDEGR